jgi:asparagine synthetase B (glutamine-hydrolysing)
MEMMVAHECQHRIPDLLFASFEPASRRLSVEMNYPFLDPDLVRLVSGLSVESRYRTPAGQFSIRLEELHPRFKHAMLEVARDRVPDAIRERPRKSFTAPFGGWMFEPSFADAVLTRLRRSRFREHGIVRPDWLDRVMRRIVPGPSPWVFQLWALVTLTGWYDRFVDPPRAA